MLKTITYAFLVFSCVSICLPQSENPPVKGTWTDSGLQVPITKNLPIWISPIDDVTQHIGLTDERIRTKSEFKIRQMNLEPIDFKVTYPPQPYQLMISVQASQNSFLIELHFVRRVSYKVGNKDFEMFSLKLPYRA